MKRFEILVNEKAYLVEVIKTGPESAHVTVNGTPFQIGLKELTAAKAPHAMVVSEPLPAGIPPAAASGSKPGKTVETIGGITTVRAPLPGLILDIKVNVGDRVDVGDVLLVIETMKMENNIVSPTAGTINEIMVSSGTNVGEGVKLISIKA